MFSSLPTAARKYCRVAASSDDGALHRRGRAGRADEASWGHRCSRSDPRTPPHRTGPGTRAPPHPSPPSQQELGSNPGHRVTLAASRAASFSFLVLETPKREASQAEQEAELPGEPAAWAGLPGVHPGGSGGRETAARGSGGRRCDRPRAPASAPALAPAPGRVLAPSPRRGPDPHPSASTPGPVTVPFPRLDPAST